MKIEAADQTNFALESLDSFDRYQEVKQIYRLVNGSLILCSNPFVETWTAERKREKAELILSGVYVTLCAFENGKVVGELMLEPKLNHGRLIVESFHVSRECRRQGIGRALFAAAVEEGRKRGASALYLSACSAEETINFYLAMGCRPSEAPIREYAEDEPWDIQMECRI